LIQLPRIDNEKLQGESGIQRSLEHRSLQADEVLALSHDLCKWNGIRLFPTLSTNTSDLKRFYPLVCMTSLPESW
jgi:hypothetical protein